MSELAKVPEFLFAFVLMLGVVITVHEFGHFLVAKLCGVRVLKFSIGFGSPIGFGRFRLAWQRGGTEYVIAWFPLGGFVKMLGESLVEPESGTGEAEPESEAIEADPSEFLNAKPAWQKLAILFAGPAMNLLLPVLIYTGSLAVGIERGDAVVGSVDRGSPAAAAGVRSGDRLRAVDGEPVRWWSEVEKAIRERAGQQMTLSLERNGEPLEATLVVSDRPGLDPFRTRRDVGWAGLQHPRHRAVLGVPDADSPAAEAGLRSGDEVVAVDGAAVADWGEMADAYAGTRGTASLRVERGPEGEEETHQVAVPALGDLDALGVIPAAALVASVEEGSAADEAGVEAGDLIVAVDGLPIGTFFTFQEVVRASEGRTLELQLARDGETLVLPVTPRYVKRDTGVAVEEIYLIGIMGEIAAFPGASATDREVNPLVAVPRAAQMAWEQTVYFLGGLKRLLVGDLSLKNVGGPIEIARVSHSAFQMGWETFLGLLVLISINVGILNLLPIPILDGGQALLVTIEGVKRSPLSLRTREIVQQVGLVMLLLIMGMAFWNDFSRNWSSFVDWIGGL